MYLGVVWRRSEHGRSFASDQSSVRFKYKEKRNTLRCGLRDELGKSLVYGSVRPTCGCACADWREIAFFETEKKSI